MRHLFDRFLNRPNLNLDISNKCTLECIACSRQTNRFAGNSIPGYDTSISQWTKMCKHFNQLHLCGQISDPIFNPNLSKFVEIAKEHKIKYLSIHTAATAKHRNFEWYKKINEIYPERTFWKFGLDGFADVSHIYRTNQDSEFLFNTMVKLKEMGANVEWQFIIFSFNEHQIEDAKKFCKEKKIKLLFKKSSRFTYMSSGVPKNKENYVQPTFNR
tara:strand:+ start:80 stop:724 length:645 start_codon:yes stop_codon:yes gene_type:complete